jgi:hypothetical protein
MPAPATIDATRCPICGADNRCAMEIERETGVKQGACWCVNMDFGADLLAQVPADARGRACICAACAAKAARGEPR